MATKHKPYKIVDSKSRMILEHCANMIEAKQLRTAYANIGYRDATIVETAASGSTGASSIATNRSGDSNLTPLHTMKKFMNEFNKRVRNRMHGKQLNNFFITVNESFDLDNVFSRLASMERTGKPKKTEGVTFGIEDDNGNIMKVTVDANQASAFEQAVARYLADIKLNVEGIPPARNSRNISMAELLFKMKSQFQIIDVDFPKIPEDVIYNVDDASYKPSTKQTDDDGHPQTKALDLTKPYKDDESYATDDETDTNDANMDIDAEDDIEGDSESVEDLTGNTNDSEKSILKQVIDMLKAQAESDIEKAKAEAEKAKSEQARYAAQATQFAVKNKEDELRYQMEIEEEKRKEKEAKHIEDVARRRLSDTVSSVKRIGEADDTMGPATVMRQRQDIAARYADKPDDTPETRAFKAKQRTEAMREWSAKYRQAVNKSRFDAATTAKEQHDDAADANAK